MNDILCTVSFPILIVLLLLSGVVTYRDRQALRRIDHSSYRWQTTLVVFGVVQIILLLCSTVAIAFVMASDQRLDWKESAVPWTLQSMFFTNVRSRTRTCRGANDSDFPPSATIFAILLVAETSSSCCNDSLYGRQRCNIPFFVSVMQRLITYADPCSGPDGTTLYEMILLVFAFVGSICSTIFSSH
jgi:hypothetical protein